MALTIALALAVGPPAAAQSSFGQLSHFDENAGVSWAADSAYRRASALVSTAQQAAPPAGLPVLPSSDPSSAADGAPGPEDLDTRELLAPLRGLLYGSLDEASASARPWIAEVNGGIYPTVSAARQTVQPSVDADVLPIAGDVAERLPVCGSHDDLPVRNPLTDRGGMNCLGRDPSGGSRLPRTASPGAGPPLEVGAEAELLTLRPLSGEVLSGSPVPSSAEALAKAPQSWSPVATASATPSSAASDAASGLVAVATIAIALLAAALYRRLTSALVREQEVRAAICARVRDEPGVTVAELARALSLHASTVRYHCDTLAEFGALVLHADGRFVRVFENGGKFAPEQRIQIAFRRRGAARLLAAIPPEGVSPAVLARRLGVSRQAVHKQLSRLAHAGLVRIERKGRELWIHGAQPTH